MYIFVHYAMDRLGFCMNDMLSNLYQRDFKYGDHHSIILSRISGDPHSGLCEFLLDRKAPIGTYARYQYWLLKMNSDQFQ